MKSVSIAIYVAIIIWFARKICNKSVSSQENTVKSRAGLPESFNDRNFYIPPAGTINPKNLHSVIASALGIPKDRMAIIPANGPNSVQVAFRDHKLADKVAKRLQQAAPSFGTRDEALFGSIVQKEI